MALDSGAVGREIDKAVEDYAATLGTEQVTGEAELVTAVLRLDGTLDDIRIDQRAIRALGADGLGAALTEAIRAAERAADGRSRDLADQVTVLGHPVFELIEEMVNEPAAAVRRLAGYGWWH
jgi:DNA-binding protein YbaB